MRGVVVLALAYLVASRAFELAWSRRNLGLLAPLRPRVVPRDGLAGIVCLQALWLAGIAVEERLRGPSFDQPLVVGSLGALFAMSELVRFACIRALGPRWNVRVVVVENACLVRRGPYAWMRHPNYAAVMVGLVALPLALGLPYVAATVLPLIPLAFRVRIRAEDAALGAAPSRARAER